MKMHHARLHRPTVGLAFTEYSVNPMVKNELPLLTYVIRLHGTTWNPNCLERHLRQDMHVTVQNGHMMHLVIIC